MCAAPAVSPYGIPLAVSRASSKRTSFIAPTRSLACEMEVRGFGPAAAFYAARTFTDFPGALLVPRFSQVIQSG